MTIVKEFIFERNPTVQGLALDDDLIDGRVIDSTAFVDFVLLLEELGGRPIDPARLNIEDFRTLRRIDERFLDGAQRDTGGTSAPLAPGPAAAPETRTDRPATEGTEDTDGDRLAVLGPEEMRLFRALDDHFRGWADEIGALEGRYPLLLRPADLDTIDYFDNFPQLGLAVAPLRADAVADAVAGLPRPIGPLPGALLADAPYLLPSAGCYALYATLKGRQLPAGGERHTTLGTVFRNEDHYDGLRRLLGFSQREIVFVGPADGARAHLEAIKPRVLGFADALGVELAVEVATDPFFDDSGSRAQTQALLPTKEEFLADGLAVSSLNYHRNFFGERFGIRAGDTVAHTSCLGLGIERWVHVLTARFGSAGAAAEAVAGLA